MTNRKLFFILFAALLLTPASISLAVGGDNPGFPGGDNPRPPGGDNPPNTVVLTNPLGEIETFPELIKAVLDAAFILGVPVAVLFIVFAGFKFVWARGNPTELQKAKTTLLYTIIGIAVFFGAWLITEVIVGTLERLNVNI